jgi:hypothetical protein
MPASLSAPRTDDAGTAGGFDGRCRQPLEAKTAIANPDTPRHEHPFHGFDQSVERAIGADMRLVYGFAVPILMVVGLIVILALSPATWLVITILLVEVAALGVVVTGFVGMLNEPHEGEAP